MLVERKHVYSGKVVNLIVEQLKVKERPCLREVIRHPGGVAVLAESKKNGILFVRQHRYPINRSLLELPAGKIDPGESPASTAGRELEEETGFRPRSLEHLFSFYPSPDFCTELLHPYYTNQLEKARQMLEPEEEIVVEAYSLEEAIGSVFREKSSMLKRSWPSSGSTGKGRFKPTASPDMFNRETCRHTC